MIIVYVLFCCFIVMGMFEDYVFCQILDVVNGFDFVVFQEQLFKVVSFFLEFVLECVFVKQVKGYVLKDCKRLLLNVELLKKIWFFYVYE